MTASRSGVTAAALAAAVALLAGACADDPGSAASTPPVPSPSESGSSPVPPSTAGTATGSPTSPRPTSPRPTTPTPTGPSTTAPADCAGRVIAAMSTREKAAQLLMAGVHSTGMTSAERRALRKHRPGGILLFMASGSADSVRKVTAAAQAAAGRPHGIGAVVSADQEGGRVQRLKGDGFSTIPSAKVQSGWPAAELTRRAAGWGRQLRAAGVQVDLAPVADVVPAGTADDNAPIGALDRGYGSDPEAVGADVGAFVRGMRSAGVATSVKHFPGLGRVRGNTDFAAGVVDRTTTRRDPALGSFRDGVEAGADLVMVSTATYSRIDPDARAVFSRTVIQGMIRGDLGFDGVVITDDVGIAAEVRSVPAGERAVRFVAAGGDVVITADATLAGPMIDALVARAAKDKTFAAGLDGHVRRVLAMKQRLGLACG